MVTQIQFSFGKTSHFSSNVSSWSALCSNGICSCLSSNNTMGTYSVWALWCSIRMILFDLRSTSMGRIYYSPLGRRSLERSGSLPRTLQPRTGQVRVQTAWDSATHALLCLMPITGYCELLLILKVCASDLRTC